jgi:biopolymer transport protein ExbD
MNLGRRKRIQPMIPIASMGDIAFLLIIFFLLTSQMKESHIELELPANPLLEEMEPTHVSIAVDDTGQVYLEGIAIHLDSLEPGVSALLEDRTDPTVIVRIDKKLAYAEYGPVIQAVSEAGGDVVLVGERGE